MKVQRAPLVAATLIILAGAIPPAYTQLPPTNMGKWVHQPGDNQYGTQAQNSRHALPPQTAAPAQMQGGGGGYSGGWTPTPPQPRADVSLDPIAADEPVAPAGFPPLPDRLDLPVQSSWAGGGVGSGGGYRPGGGGGAYGGAAPPGMSGGGPPQPQFSGTHQHYNHYEAGSFGQSASHGYYKANTPPPPNAPTNDYYATNTPGGGGPGTGPAAPSDAERALRGLGKEPKLNNKLDTSPSAEAPQPVIVNQATTQDLSLPEDDFAYQRPPTNNNSVGKKVGRSVKRAILRPINSAGSFAGISF